MGKILHRERAEGVDSRLLSLVDAFADQVDFACIVLSGVRTAADQIALYAQGRTVAGPNVRPGKPLGDVVTFAMPDQAPHCRGGALDVAPLGDDGHLHWANHDPLFSQYMARQSRLGTIARTLGVAWGGDWIHFKDWDHFEVPDWRALTMK